ncbi:MAG: nucleoside triphosphate pyrophosphohydrolase [Firmicutes bacterium]|nr:nucleoside triphosphate pyrophosphohydrolase [Bacillota bacterium]
MVRKLSCRAPAWGHRIRIIPGISLAVPGKNRSLQRLERIMTLLRSPRGCPWDRRQTHHSLRGCLIEEAYEVIAAIERKDVVALEEELGDLLLQIIFHSEIAREEGFFDLNAVIEGLIDKLIRRHPHVFGAARETTLAGAAVRWEEVKDLERGKGEAGRMQVDPALPALLRAYKVQQRAAAFGFDWPSLEGAVEKLKEEAAELEDAYSLGVPDRIEEEYGDFLFAAVNVARFLKINPELALGKALQKFLARFSHISSQAAKKNRSINSFSLEEMDRWWEEAKIKEITAKKQESSSQ